MAHELRVEVSRTIAEQHDKDTGLTFEQEVRKAQLIYGQIFGFGGHGKHRYAWVLTRDIESYKVKVPGGYWPRSGEELVCIDLDHPIGEDREFRPCAGTEIGFELSDPEGVNTVWALWDAIKTVRDAARVISWSECDDGRVTKRRNTVGIRTVEELIIDRIENGELPDDGIRRLRKAGFLENKRIVAVLDELGIKH